MTFPLDSDLVRAAMDAPLSTAEQVAHQNEQHHLPWGGTEVIEEPDGCQFTPVYEGCWLYFDGREATAL